MGKLSERMERLADMVAERECLADVGTDHGYIPIYLCQKKRISSAIAMDIHSGPLARADVHIREAGLTSYIETRLSDGLSAFRAGEAQTVLIAGMGGPLMVRILSEGEEKLEGVRELILQPQSEVPGVRRWLLEHGYTIVREDMVREDGKFYPMFRAVPGAGGTYSEEEYAYGRVELQCSVDTLLEFVERGIQVQRQILLGLPEESFGVPERIRQRRREVEAQLCLLERTWKKARTWIGKSGEISFLDVDREE